MRQFVLAFSLLANILSAGCVRKPERIIIGIGLAPNAHAGVDLALRQINANGGIGGVPVETIGSNAPADAYVPENILAWSHRFAETKSLIGVIGHSDSASTLSAAATYNMAGIPHIVTMATNPAITNIGVWTYRLCLSDAAQGPALADYAVTWWGKRRIAIFFVNDDYGRVLAQLFEERARTLGATIIASIMHRNVLAKEDEELLRATLGKMARTHRPDLIVLFQRVAAAEWTLGAIRDSGLADVDKLGGDDLAQYSLPLRSREMTEGMRVSQFFRLDPHDESAMRFAKDFRSFAGFDPDYSQTLAYDAVYLIRDAVLNGGYSRAGVKSYLDRLVREKIVVHGVGGTYTLDPDHDARRSLYIAEIRGGRFEVIKELSLK